ncbi:16S rRNA (guanine(527)-N(7))-methyltransferase RsmG [Sphingopyxis sp. MWB1]|uniref:16S rRNA (guanine(527)-N(7))-methyltransferase RsmG n=1 Tax=Sphingopyxis sp. MWB1 TaxID=1537715 RepID=UPI000B112027|nr:16S rRNA (guanine(527)-N(7))-methyltransferase RsmG [Sphingopyxis sp. MWB1]
MNMTRDGTAPALLADEESARRWVYLLCGGDDARWKKLEDYVALVASENERQNLVAASTLPHIWVRHIADSAQLLLLDAANTDERQNRRGLWLDLGSGPGLPGLVVAILSDRPVALVESRKRRCDFLREAAQKLDLTHVEVVEDRLERVANRAVATISARAFAPLPKLITLSTRFSTDSTRWLLPKGRNAMKELALLPKAWQRMFHVEQSRTDADSYILVGEGRIGAAQRGTR